MSISGETRQKIDRFAKEQVGHYLDAAEMTYLEKLQMKTGRAKQKMGRKLARFKGTSDQAREVESDMVLYMSDCVADFMEKGLPEAEAFARAKEALTAPDASALWTDFEEKLRSEGYAASGYEAVGLLYGGFLLIGLTLGALAGYVLSGGRQVFLAGGWIDTLVGAVAGALVGIGVGEIGHGATARRDRTK